MHVTKSKLNDKQGDKNLSYITSQIHSVYISPKYISNLGNERKSECNT